MITVDSKGGIDSSEGALDCADDSDADIIGAGPGECVDSDVVVGGISSVACTVGTRVPVYIPVSAVVPAITSSAVDVVGDVEAILAISSESYSKPPNNRYARSLQSVLNSDNSAACECTIAHCQIDKPSQYSRSALSGRNSKSKGNLQGNRHRVRDEL